MPKMTGYRIKRGDSEYEIDIDFKDAAIMEEQIEFEITARSRSLPDGDWLESSASVRMVFEEFGPVALVQIGDSEEIRINLAQVDMGLYTSFEEAWQKVLDACDGNALEQAIQAIPGDPVLGCLIKAGISTTVGQTMRCYNECSGVEALRRRIRATIKCLGDNFVGMIFTATTRAFKCMILLGLG